LQRLEGAERERKKVRHGGLTQKGGKGGISLTLAADFLGQQGQEEWVMLGILSLTLQFAKNNPK